MRLNIGEEIYIFCSVLFLFFLQVLCSGGDWLGKILVLFRWLCVRDTLVRFFYCLARV